MRELGANAGILVVPTPVHGLLYVHYGVFKMRLHHLGVRSFGTQGWQDLNLRPSVLETAALAV